jgi:DNA-binding transcriptional MerR regulator
MRIGELARRAGVDAQTIRYYEREGLLDAPARTAAGYRAYGPQHLERLNFVRHCRSLDMPLATLSAQCASGQRIADRGILGELIHAAQGETCACHPHRDA